MACVKKKSRVENKKVEKTRLYDMKQYKCTFF